MLSVLVSVKLLVYNYTTFLIPAFWLIHQGVKGRVMSGLRARVLSLLPLLPTAIPAQFMLLSIRMRIDA